jgi:hypothetical protein
MVLVGGLAMTEAARTSAPPAAIWAIGVAAVVCLAFWLISVKTADRSQARIGRRQRTHDTPGPVPGGSRPAEAGPVAAGAVPQARRAPDLPAGPETQARGRHARPESDMATEPPGRPDLTGQQQTPGRHALPTRSQVPGQQETTAHPTATMEPTQSARAARPSRSAEAAQAARGSGDDWEERSILRPGSHARDDAES